MGLPNGLVWPCFWVFTSTKSLSVHERFAMPGINPEGDKNKLEVFVDGFNEALLGPQSPAKGKQTILPWRVRDGYPYPIAI